jgi:hypothetical protein
MVIKMLPKLPIYGLKPVLLMIFILLSINTCFAAEPAGNYFESNGIIQFRYGEIPNMTYLYDHMYFTNLQSETIKDNDPEYLLKNTDNSFTFINVTQFSNSYGGSIILENVTLYFNGSKSGGFLPGEWKLSNSHIISTSNPVNFQAERLGNYDMSNITFENLNSFTLNAQSYFQPYSGNISNISVYNSTNGLLLKHFEPNGYIKNLYFENIERQSFVLDDASFYEISNVTIENGGDYTNPKTYVGFIVAGGHDNTIRDIYVNASPWSGVDLTSNEYNTTLENIYVNHAGHNGVDFHGQWNCSITNVTVNGSIAENFMITGRDDMYQPSYDVVNWTPSNSNRVTHTIRITNYTSYNSTGVALSANRYIGLEVLNMTSMNNGGGILLNYAMDTVIQNAIIFDREGKPALTLGGLDRAAVHNTTVIDSYFSGYGWFLGAKNTRLLNTIIPSFSISGDTDYFNSYYADVKVIDSNGNSVPSASIKFSSSNPEMVSFNSLCGDESSFVASSNGRTFLPSEDRSNSPALIEYHYSKLDNIKEYMSYQVAVTMPSGSTATISDITPDSTWYRENPNIPTYTITAIIPDESSTEPQITGFAPSSDNPFTAGESKKFQVWADEELTTMKWYVNGNLVSSGSMDYTWKVESGSTTIMFSGFNSNGAVVQTWEITEGEIVEEAPVSSGTGLSFTPSASSLTATTGESTTFSVETTQEFTSAVWSVDGTEVETGTTGHVEAWTTAGTHTVTFDGTAAAGTISRSWTVVVSAAAESEYSSISISPSTTTVAPGESFSLDVYIDPTQALTGSQFDLQYSQLASISTVDEGDLFTTGDLATTFQYDSIDNAAGLLDNVYTAIVGSGTISSPGVMATIEMVAGSSSGILDLGLSDVILSDANSNPAGYTVSNATVLIDTAPQFTSVSAQTVEEKQSLSFTVTASDADGDDLSYSSTSLPSGATFNDGSFSWTPSQGDAGSYVATFEVTDGYLTDTVSVSITVTPLNNLPEITLFEPADGSTFEEGSIIGVNVAATDADGDSLSYIIEIDSVKVSTATSYTWTTDYESAGTHTIKVTVSDGTDEVSSSGTITITDVQPRWDVNEDGTVNVLDITLVGQNYGQTYTENLPRWDVNQDGTVNIQDLSIVSGHFGETI